MSGNKTRAEAPLLAWPSEWGKARPQAKLILALAFFSLLAVVFIPYSIDYARQGNTLRATYGVVAEVAVLTFVVMLTEIELAR